MDKRARYVRVYWEALRQFNLKHGEALLMFLVEALSRKEGPCYMSKSELARTLHVSETTIYSLIPKLRNKGLLLPPRYKKSKYGTFYLEPTERWTSFTTELKDIATDGFVDEANAAR